ncbi:ABC transporter permease [Cupriavidus necator]|uniref:ABC transporter permease n=1 Tax=Cupriavidus necator TaxID=106590 RepID=UPI00277DB78B|nr:ABC transporter permease [Cupriavidus necator]MDQ0141819.1 NitT/TauT family transport system permease protein [Cupriavidus necator]
MSESNQRRWGITLARIAVVMALFGLWELAATRNWIDPVLIGTPHLMAAYLWDGLFVSRQLLADLGWTLLGMALAFLLGSSAGILTGMLFVSRPRLEAVLDPILSAINAMPRIALAPLFLIWFGLGLGSKVAVGFSLSYFIVLSSTIAGGRGVSQDHLTLARTLGASGTQLFRTFTLPSAVPVLFSGLRLALIYSLLGVVGAEVIASEHGLGQQLSLLAANFNTSGVFGVLILLSLIGVGLMSATSWIESHLLRWR